MSSGDTLPEQGRRITSDAICLLFTMLLLHLCSNNLLPHPQPQLVQEERVHPYPSLFYIPAKKFFCFVMMVEIEEQSECCQKVGFIFWGQ